MSYADARTIAIATRCQLMTGSFDGNPTACPCECSGDCKLTPNQFNKLRDHPVILDRIKKQQELYKEITTHDH